MEDDFEEYETEDDYEMIFTSEYEQSYNEPTRFHPSHLVIIFVRVFGHIAQALVNIVNDIVLIAQDHIQYKQNQKQMHEQASIEIETLVRGEATNG